MMLSKSLKNGAFCNLTLLALDKADSCAAGSQSRAVSPANRIPSTAFPSASSR
jgi:hypothetical protein